MKKLRIMILLLIFLSLSLIACLPTIERQLVYWPTTVEVQTPADYGLNYEILNLNSEDGTALEAWVVPFATDAPWLLYFHGNASNISQNLKFPMLLRERLGVNVLMAEYRGFYKSEGIPSEEGLYQDARTYYNYLINSGVKAENLLIWGFSLGSGVALELAMSHAAAGLVLQAPYASIPDAAAWRYNAGLPDSFFQNQFTSKEKISRLTMPLLIVHGIQDDVIPVEQGQALFEMAKQPKRFVAFNGMHTTLNEQGDKRLAFVVDEILEELHVLIGFSLVKTEN